MSREEENFFEKSAMRQLKAAKRAKKIPISSNLPVVRNIRRTRAKQTAIEIRTS
jgi:hypothetical protein